MGLLAGRAVPQKREAERDESAGVRISSSDISLSHKSHYGLLRHVSQGSLVVPESVQIRDHVRDRNTACTQNMQGRKSFHGGTFIQCILILSSHISHVTLTVKSKVVL